MYKRYTPYIYQMYLFVYNRCNNKINKVLVKWKKQKDIKVITQKEYEVWKKHSIRTAIFKIISIGGKPGTI